MYCPDKSTYFQWLLCLGLSVVTVLSLTKATPVGQGRVESCLAAARVPFLARDSPSWNHTISLYNRRVSANPATIVVPVSTEQVQVAVLCGVKHKLRVTAKGRGHGFGSHGLGGEDGHLLIALEGMNRVNLHGEIARVQPGARLGDMALELFSQGSRALPHGECPSVGIAGHVLHGGVGMATRTYGMTLDWLVGATVVLANGKIVHCSATENPDLFWALRGAGSSFGIVTELELKTFEAPKHSTVFIIESMWAQNQAARALKALQDVVSEAPKELNILLFLVNTRITIKGVYYGDQDGLRQVLRPFLEATNLQFKSIQTVGWIESLEAFSFTDSLKQTKEEHDNFYVTSVLTSNLSEDQLASFTAALYKDIYTPKRFHTLTVFMEIFGGRHSVMPGNPSGDAAFAHRDKPNLIQLFSQSPKSYYPAAGFSAVRGIRESITNSSGDGRWGMYTNYIDTEIDSETAAKLYWGNNLERLRRIKTDLDPDDVFWNPQGVRPAT